MVLQTLRLCPKTRSGFERLVFRLTASGSIDDKANIACFAVFARRKTARSRADDGVFRQSLILVYRQRYFILRVPQIDVFYADRKRTVLPIIAPELG